MAKIVLKNAKTVLKIAKNCSAVECSFGVGYAFKGNKIQCSFSSQ